MSYQTVDEYYEEIDKNWKLAPTRHPIATNAIAGATGSAVGGLIVGGPKVAAVTGAAGALVGAGVGANVRRMQKHPKGPIGQMYSGERKTADRMHETEKAKKAKMKKSYNTVDEYYEELAKALPLNAAEYLRRMPKPTGTGAHALDESPRVKAGLAQSTKNAMKAEPPKGLPSPALEADQAAHDLSGSVKGSRVARDKKLVKKSFNTADEYMAEIEEIQKLTERQINGTIGGAAGGFVGPPGGAVAGALVAGKHHRGEGAAKGFVGGVFGPPGSALIGAHLATKYPVRGVKPSKKSKKSPTSENGS